MALPLDQAAILTNDVLQQGIVELLVKDNPVLKRMPFIEVLGDGKTYNVETTMPNAEFYDVQEDLEESSGTRTPSTATLRRLGGFVDVDNFEKTVVAADQDLTTIETMSKVKATEWQFMNQLFYGTAAKGFSGLHSLISDTTYNTVHTGSATGASGTALSIDKLRQSIDLVVGTKPEMIISTKKMRRLMTTYMDSVGSAFPVARDQFGIFCKYFDEIPWYVCDFMVDTETVSGGAYAAKTGGYNTTIFVLSFNPQPKALMGIQAAGGIQVVPWGKTPKKDAERYLVKWYCSTMLQAIITCAKVDGILSTGAVTA